MKIYNLRFHPLKHKSTFSKFIPSCQRIPSPFACQKTYTFKLVYYFSLVLFRPCNWMFLRLVFYFLTDILYLSQTKFSLAKKKKKKSPRHFCPSFYLIHIFFLIFFSPLRQYRNGCYYCIIIE